MLRVTTLESVPSFSSPIGLTIGSFDGVHLGHQFLLKTLRSLIGPEGILTALTFSNHPADVIPGRTKTPLLCSLAYKLQLLEREGVDLAIVLAFTQALSEVPYDLFIKNIFDKLPFSELVLGKGAAFGKARQGNEERLTKLGEEIGFRATYLNKENALGAACSSGRIRSALTQGNLKEVATLLGRPYALSGELKNKIINTTNLCLPPPGDYPVIIKVNGASLPGTLHIDETATLSCEENLLGCRIEAIFL